MVCTSVWILILNVLQTGSQLPPLSQESHPGQRSSPSPPPSHPAPPLQDTPTSLGATTVLPATPAAGQRIITRQLYNNARPLLTSLQPAIIIPGGAGGHLGVHMVRLEKKAGKVRDLMNGLICYSLYKELQYLRARTRKIYTARRKQNTEILGDDYDLSSCRVWSSDSAVPQPQFTITYMTRTHCGGQTLLEHVAYLGGFGCVACCFSWNWLSPWRWNKMSGIFTKSSLHIRFRFFQT